MKKITLFTALLAMGASVYAQGPKHKMDHTKLPKPLTEQLKLTADQQTKVDAILADKNVEIDSLVKKATIRNGKLTGAKIRSTESETNDKLYAVFTNDQKLVYAQWILDRRANMIKGKPAKPQAMAKQ